jgi:hypothetical protein
MNTKPANNHSPLNALAAQANGTLAPRARYSTTPATRLRIRVRFVAPHCFGVPVVAAAWLKRRRNAGERDRRTTLHLSFCTTAQRNGVGVNLTRRDSVQPGSTTEAL